METIGYFFAGIGFLGMFIGGIWLLLTAFQESVLWGLGCILVPLVSLFFLVNHWDKAGKPFLLQLASLLPFFLGVFLINAAR